MFYTVDICNTIWYTLFVKKRGNVYGKQKRICKKS